MNEDTPLREVAQHIPAAVAMELIELSEDLQESVLMTVRAAVLGLEEMGCHLDPVQYDAVVSQFAIIAMPAHQEIVRLRMSMLGAAVWIEGQVNPGG